MKQMALLVFFLLLNFRVYANESIIGGPCEGCEYVFTDMPLSLASQARIVADGEPLVIEGVVQGRDDKPVPGIIVYAYQTDQAGIYPRGETAHGSLRAWVRTDHKGRYRFDTIRPGAYPKRKIPQHVHMHIIEPGKATYYIGDIYFEDDPLLRDSLKEKQTRARGGSGLVRPVKDDKGAWRVKRIITLGLNIPGYK